MEKKRRIKGEYHRKISNFDKKFAPDKKIQKVCTAIIIKNKKKLSKNCKKCSLFQKTVI
ncbi:MAG: hypothetical protein MRZ69_03965 [Lachnospiraceae bacterium]|nr:hypothetical protein [Lachnospiraceae bacterium]